MAQTKDEDLPLNKMVTRVAMYGTDHSPFHKYGEKTMVDPTMVSHFEARGLSLTKPPDKVDEANKKGGEKL